MFIDQNVLLAVAGLDPSTQRTALIAMEFTCSSTLPGRQWSGFDFRYPPGGKRVKANVKSKAPLRLYIH
ncbi:MAG: hypothetical protein ACTHJS_06375 [Xanthobacteraceae bacterium]